MDDSDSLNIDDLYVDNMQAPSTRVNDSTAGADLMIPGADGNFDLFGIDEDIDSGAMHLDTQGGPANKSQLDFPWNTGLQYDSDHVPVVATATQVPGPTHGDSSSQPRTGNVYLNTYGVSKVVTNLI